MMRGYQLSQALYVAAALGVADHLAGGAQDCGTLARATGTDEASLYRLLRTLASRGVFAESPGHRFSLTDAGVVDRCRVIGGDYFADIPAGGDAYVFSNIMMDQEDAEVLTLLRSCRAAMAANGRVIIVERVIPASNAPSLAHLSDLMSLAVTGGRIRSEEEFDALFAASGLRCRRSVPLPSGYTVVEARPV
jgi:hypothetical protein